MKTDKTVEMLKAKRKQLLLLREKIDFNDKQERKKVDLKLATVTNQLYMLTNNPIYIINKTQRFNKKRGFEDL